MYSQRFTHNQVLEAETSLGRPLNYYDYSYIRACVDHLDGLAERDQYGRVTGTKRPLAADESAFITNERILCALDYVHWAENYHWIRQVESLAIVPFKQNSYQQILTLAQGELEDAGKPNLVQLLKARQGGGTTDTTSKIFHRMLFVPNTAAVIASSDPDKSWKLSDMISRSLPLQPWWIVPPHLKSYSSGETFMEYDIKLSRRNSYISIQHGTQGSGIARGDTVNAYHFSEIPDWTDHQLIIEDSLFGAWHPTRMHFGVMESTAKGRGDWWHKRWLENKVAWPQGLTLERPLFLPYYISPEIYPTPDWLNSIPIPHNWEPAAYVKDHVRKCQEEVRSNPFLRKILGDGWEMRREMQWWYQFSYDLAVRKDKLGNFLSEFPSSDTEAFQSKSKSVFSITLIQEYENRIPLPVGVFKLRGSDLPKHLTPDADQILVEGKDIPIHWEHPTGNLDWTLLPIKFPGYNAINNHMNTLWVWEYPKDNEDYCVAMDIAEGVGKDRTVIGVVRKGTVARAAGLVAIFTTDNMAGTECWPIAFMLLVYYTTWSDFHRDVTKPLFAPEINFDRGATLLEVRKRGWTNIYLNRERAKRDQDAGKLTKLGFETTQATRKLLVDWLMTILKGHYIELNSKWTIDEMRDFVIIETETAQRITYKIEHDKNKHDDELIMLAIAIVCLHALDVYRGQTPQWRAAQEELEKLVQFATYREGEPRNYFDPGDLNKDNEIRKGVLHPVDVRRLN